MDAYIPPHLFIPVALAQDSGNYTALMEASSMGHDDVVEELLKDGADVNIKSTSVSSD